MKKSILTVAILALSSASFAGAYVDLPGDPVLPTNSVDCGGASTCMPDQTLNQGDNTSTKTAQQDLNGNAVTISPVLTDENVNKTISLEAILPLQEALTLLQVERIPQVHYQVVQ